MRKAFIGAERKREREVSGLGEPREGVFSPYAAMRQNRLKTVLRYIAERKKASLDEIVGKFCIEWGLRSQKIREYLKELEAASYIKLVDVADLDNPLAETQLVLITEKGMEAAKE
ncbi:MAG: hypothetical protein QW688_09885 [Thermoprotei archaeon]